MYILAPLLLISATQAIIGNVINTALRKHHEEVDRANERDGMLNYTNMSKKELLGLHRAVSREFNEKYQYCQEAVFNNEEAPVGLKDMYEVAQKELDLKEIGVTILFMLYTTMSTKTLEPLICSSQPDGRYGRYGQGVGIQTSNPSILFFFVPLSSFLVMDPKVECWKGSHLKFAIFSGGAFLFYSFVLPWFYRHSIKALARQKYEHHHYWWEWMLFLAKLVFSIALCVFPGWRIVYSNEMFLP